MSNVLSRLDTTHNDLLNIIAPVDEKSFAQRPTDDKWSVGEIVHHLRLVEERVIKELTAGLERPPRQLGLLRQLMPTAVAASRLVRVQAPKAVLPTAPPAKEASVAAYNDARHRLKELYNAQGAARLRQITLKHPFFGEITGLAAISFVGYHERRHYKQIKEVLKTLQR